MLRCSVLVAKVATGAPVGFASGFASVDSFGVACEAVSVVVLMESFRALLWSRSVCVCALNICEPHQRGKGGECRAPVISLYVLPLIFCGAAPVSGGGCGGGRPPLRALFLRAPSSCGRMLPLASCPVAQMNQSNTPYLLRPFFYELGHFHGDGLLPVVSGLLRVIVLRQQKRATNPEAHWAAFP